MALVRIPDAGVPKTGAVNTGAAKVLFVKVSAPANVANVPVVGKITFVAAVAVNVCENAPAVANVLLSANVKVAAIAGAVNVNLLILVALATPKTGVTKVGAVSITNLDPVPVWEATEVVFPTLVMGPVKLALVALAVVTKAVVAS